MDRSGSQKALRVISIISIVCGVIMLLSGLMFALAGGFIGAVPASESGLTADQTTVASMGSAVIGVGLIIAAAIAILEGVLGLRAAKDNQKIMPVWVLSLIGLIFGVIAFVMAIVNGSFGSDALSNILSLAVSAAMFWIANNIKVEAGK